VIDGMIRTSTHNAPQPTAAAGALPAAVGAHRARESEPTFLAVLTLVLWLMALAVGVLGMWLSRPPPKPPPREPQPLRAQLIEVAIDTDLTQTAAEDAPPAPDQPPREALAQPPAPPLPMVAAPSPAIAFAVPVEGPAQIVAAARAPPAPPVTPVPAPKAQPPAPPRPAVQRLTYGQGEGRQPAPEYPQAAVLERQEGAVGVRFAVAEDGRVLNAEVITPSRWPLLNQAALQAVRYRWQFHSGSPRVYEVSIRFKLNLQ
jgi:protein TonB